MRSRNKNKMPKIIFANLKPDEEAILKLKKMTNCLITKMIEKGVIQKENLGRMSIHSDKGTGLLHPGFHVTLFRVR